MYPNYQSISTLHVFHSIAPALLLPLLIIVLGWTIIIKGFALWYAARNGQKWWFVILLVVNTLGIVEILYLIFWRKNKIASAVVSSSADAT